jgi:peptidoglycan L-alanyl-D-glutamate endopeptidase CwlK
MTEFRFGHNSLTHLLTCHADLQQIAQMAIRTSEIDFAITCGHRNRFDQDKCCVEGKSKTPWPTSKHNSTPSRAFDFVPIIDGKAAWGDREAFRTVAHAILCAADHFGYRVRWGGTWTDKASDPPGKFVDMPHIELRD